jgi:hypothetical protein
MVQNGFVFLKLNILFVNITYDVQWAYSIPIPQSDALNKYQGILRYAHPRTFGLSPPLGVIGLIPT